MSEVVVVGVQGPLDISRGKTTEDLGGNNFVEEHQNYWKDMHYRIAWRHRAY